MVASVAASPEYLAYFAALAEAASRRRRHRRKYQSVPMLSSPRVSTVGPPPCAAVQNVGGGEGGGGEGGAGGEGGGGDGGTDGDMSETITCGGVTLSTRLLSATKPPLPSLMLTEAKGRAWIKVSISWTIPEYPSVTTTAYTTFGNGGGGGGGADGGRC